MENQEQAEQPEMTLSLQHAHVQIATELYSDLHVDSKTMDVQQSLNLNSKHLNVQNLEIVHT